MCAKKFEKQKEKWPLVITPVCSNFTLDSSSFTILLLIILIPHHNCTFWTSQNALSVIISVVGIYVS